MNASDILKYGDSFLQGCLEGIPESAWETPNVCGVWSSKDIVGHLASYENVLTEILNLFLDKGPTPLMEAWAGGQTFNDTQVGMRANRPPREVLDEYNAGHARNMGLIARIPAETARQVGTLPWYGPEYALDDFLVYSFYGHKREHGAQINVFKDTL